MSKENRDFKGVWIPKEIWLDNNLNITEKMFISLFKTDIELNDNKTTSKYMNTSTSSISVLKKNLIEKGYFKKTKYTKQEIVNMLKNKNLKNKGLGDKECEWCKTKTLILHEHHYPMKKENGGKEVVKICPNCHQEFHQLENGRLEYIGPEEIFDSNGDVI